MNESGLMRVGPVVIVSGPALERARNAAIIAANSRRDNGVPYDVYAAMAGIFSAAMSADAHADVRSPAVSDAVDVEQPTVPSEEVAERLGCTPRHARRIAQRLGGRKIRGRWYVTSTALAEHIEGRTP